MQKIEIYRIDGIATATFLVELKKQFFESNTSKLLTLDYVVPQGSIMGPLIYSLYVLNFHCVVECVCVWSIVFSTILRTEDYL